MAADLIAAVLGHLGIPIATVVVVSRAMVLCLGFHEEDITNAARIALLLMAHIKHCS